MIFFKKNKFNGWSEYLKAVVAPYAKASQNLLVSSPSKKLMKIYKNKFSSFSLNLE